MRACKVEMHVEMSEEPLCLEIYRKSAQAQNLGAHFVRTCAVEMHVNMSQEPLYTEIYTQNAGAQNERPDQTSAFTLTARTPQCGHFVWGTYRKNP